MSEANVPVLIYDGECAFCRTWIEQWRKQTGPRVRYATSQEAASEHPQIPAAEFEKSVVLIEPGEKVSVGAEAVFRSLSYAPGHGWWIRVYERFPGFAPFTELMYRWVARNRGWLWMPRTR